MKVHESKKLYKIFVNEKIYIIIITEPSFLKCSSANEKVGFSGGGGNISFHSDPLSVPISKPAACECSPGTDFT